MSLSFEKRGTTRSRKKTIVLAAAVLCLAAGIVATAGPRLARAQEGQPLEERLKQKDAELQKLREEIVAERKKIEEVEKKEQSIGGYLDKLQNEERLTKRLLTGLNEKEGMLEDRVRGLRSDLEVSERMYDRRLTILSTRLREMYKDGSQAGWMELLAANDFADLLQRYKFISAIAVQDANLVEEVRKRKTDIASEEAELTEKLQEVTSARQEKESELARLADNERKRERSLAQLKASKSKFQRRIEELAKAERDLQSIIGNLESQRAAAPAAAWEANAERDFQALRGRMLPPVEGPLVRGFGESRHPEFKTVTFNPGIDIDARAGSPVRAVAKGRVEYASLLPGFGNCIIIAHGQGYYTLYAHTSKMFVKQGAMVSGGDIIAEAEGSQAAGSSFHFEIRKSKKPLDPTEWLRR
jgi:murein hydrolase activator